MCSDFPRALRVLRGKIDDPTCFLPGCAWKTWRTNRDLTSRVFEPMFKSFVQEARGDDRGSGLSGLTKLIWFLVSLVDSTAAASSKIFQRCKDSSSVEWLGSDGRSVPPDECLKRWLIGFKRFFSRGAEPERSFASKVQIVAHPLVQFLTKKFGCGPGRWISFTIRHA